MDSYLVKKRTGQMVEFDIKKISTAITKAFETTKTPYTLDVIELITLRVTAGLADKVKQIDNTRFIGIEDIQDTVESILQSCYYSNVAKAYILYRKQHENVRNVENTVINYKNIVDDYLGINDWRVKENSTVTYSVGGLILSNSGAVTANYWLSEIYDKEIADAHRNAEIHIHDLSMLTGYCAGWSLKQLIVEGLGGVPGKITSAPASHLSTLCNQMVNFLGIMQNEWAGAQAFSSFDTYLAPFVKVDNLSYKETKQAIQSFVYGVNTPSRWGCVDADTEVLSENGFKKYNELKEGDLIYTWNDGTLELNPVRKVIIKPFKGKMHAYKGRGYNQTVTPNHRVLTKQFNADEYKIRLSDEIFDLKSCYPLPTKFKQSNISAANLTDDEIKLAAMVYTDGSIEYTENGTVKKVMIFKSPRRYGFDEAIKVSNNLGLKYTVKDHRGGFGSTVRKITFYGDSARRIVDLVGQKSRIDSKFYNMNMYQANLFLRTWAAFDGNKNKFRCQYDNNVIRDQLQQIAILAGATSYLYSRNKTNYVKIRQNSCINPTNRETIEYDDIVWCPNVENGTAVFRKDGCVYISGQTQAPFSNITLDWVVPDDLKDQPAIVGGKPQNFTYGDCKREMDMVNRAFIEIMIEGDANGRGFQYPIPTYSITKNFDWSETENNKLLFEMTAKYGTPYFSNYINSDMEPSDVRSMCLMPDTNVWARFNGKTKKCTLEYLYNNANSNTQILTKYGYRPIKEVQRFQYSGNMLTFTTDSGHSITSTIDHEHVVYSDGRLTKKKAYELQLGDKFSCRSMNPGELRRGLTYEQSYGKVKAEKIQALYRKQRQGQWTGDKNPVYGGLSKTWRENISKSMEGHYVSETCRNASSKRWQGDKNPNKTNGGRTHNRQYSVSKYESEFAKELQALAIDYINQYYIDGVGIADFYIPSKNLIIELETDYRWETCSYNDISTIHISGLKDKYSSILEMGYNLLVFNPELDNSSYREYINKVEQIVDIVESCYDGFVYDLEVDCDDIDGDNTLYHTFYANEILTGNCCRLRLDLRELRKKSGGFFGSGESTGSVGVVTINMPRIAYLATDEKDFYNRLNKLMDIAARSLKTKRTVISKLMDAGLYPYTKRYLGTFDNHFSTIGLVGMNEAGLNAKWLRHDLTYKDTQEFTKNVLNYMREKLSDYQELYGDLYNLEATPAESTTYRFAKHDKEKFPDIITANEHGTPYYTNSSHLPVNYTDDVFSALDIQDELQTLYTSGTVFHTFLGEKLPDWKTAANLVRKIAENYKLPYYTISPTYSVCKNHGYLVGEQYKCPHCNEKTEVYSRITGYYRPIQNWNDGKAQEYQDRKEYDVGQHNVSNNFICEDCNVDADTDVDTANYTECYIFTTNVCPNCNTAKSWLSSVGVHYNVVTPQTDTKNFASMFNIKTVPTLIVSKSHNADASNSLVFRGLGEIRNYLNNL